MIGKTISHYVIEEKLGEGGMGVLYRARDTRLDRTIAIKILRPEAVDREDRRWRFVQEAKAASALNHPNIITIHDIDRIPDGGQDFVAMEYVKGKSLGELTSDHGLPIERVLSYSVQIADALASAHQAGIIHRDIKPANVMVTDTGRIKVLDFGLAKLLVRETAGPDATTLPQSPRTEKGVLMGTPAYMSPEQALGKPVDARSDVFSFGCLLYEMLTGKRPFQGDSLFSTINAILHESPPPLKSLRPDVPPDLERIISRCLEKSPEARFASGRELHGELAVCQSRLTEARLGLKAILRRPVYAIPLILIVLAIGVAGTWRTIGSARGRWARNTALPRIVQLIDEENIAGALLIAKQARRYIPDDPELQRLWEDIAIPLSIETTPAGADVYMKAYKSAGADWEWLGKSPIAEIVIPKYSYLRWKVTKEGYETRELGAYPLNTFSITLDATDTVPAGMTHVRGGSFAPFNSTAADLEDYWLDKYEVTNQQFQEFVDAGGYREQKYWKHPFTREGKDISWTEAIAAFHDATGRPGPSTWEGGTYREGQGDFPVTGVSWYEAAAYAEFKEKALPTIYHWLYAAGGIGTSAGWVSDILFSSNIGGEELVPVGRYEGISPHGNYDMAGNAKEWCWNLADGERRYILGGGWNEPRYMFQSEDAQSPLDRSATYGFRLAKYATPLVTGETAADAALPTRPMPLPRKDTASAPAEVVSDEVFEHFRRLYGYDHVALNPAVESVDDGYEHWRKETVSFKAVYSDERVPAYLFIPRNAAPPYQTVIYFPEGDSLGLKSSRVLYLRFVDFIIRSGRAVMYPVYQATYERRGVPLRNRGPHEMRDLNIQWSQDLGRSLDYLETRSDIDSNRLAYVGLSYGSYKAPILLAIEDRFKAAVLVAGCLNKKAGLLPEIDPENFVGHARVPLLMVNGRHDYDCVLNSQIKLLRSWGAPDENKRHALLESGHIPPRNAIIKEVLDWLDRYLGPVETHRSK